MVARSNPSGTTWRPELHDGFVRLVGDEAQVDYHLIWLRDVVGCTQQELEVDEIAVDDGVLRIRWRSDGRTSRFPLAWLLGQAYSVGRDAPARPPSDPALLELVGDGDPRGLVPRMLALVAEVGAAWIRRQSHTTPIEIPSWTVALAEHDLHPTGHLAEFSIAEIQVPPALPTSDDAGIQYQVLYVVEGGGELVLADAHAAYHYLESLDADAASHLIATPVRAGARPRLPFNKMESWFRARERFASIVRDRRHHYRLMPRAGDIVVFDRHRMLYGQTAASRSVLGLTYLRSDLDRSG